MKRMSRGGAASWKGGTGTGRNAVCSVGARGPARNDLDRKDILKKQGNDVTLWRAAKKEWRLNEEYS